MSAKDSDLVETGIAYVKSFVVWLAKFFGICIGGAGVMHILGFIKGFFPSISFVFTIVQLVIGLAIFMALDNTLPMWFKDRIPVIRIGADSRAARYARWYAWYSV